MAVKRTTKNVLEWCVRDLLALRRQLLSRSEQVVLAECGKLSKVRRPTLFWRVCGGKLLRGVSVCVSSAGEGAGQPVAASEGPEQP